MEASVNTKCAEIQIGLALSKHNYVRWMSMPVGKSSHGNEPQTEAPMSGKFQTNTVSTIIMM